MNEEMEKINGEQNQENNDVQPAQAKPPIANKINLSEFSFFQPKSVAPAPAPVAQTEETPPVAPAPIIPAPMTFPTSEEEPAQATEEIAPVAEEIVPVAEEVAPVAEEVAPVAEEVAPIAEEVAPVVEEMVEETTPIAEEAATEETVSVEEETPEEEVIDEALAIDLQEVQTMIGQHYTKVLALLKYNKEKDANVNKLTKQLDEYRDGFGDGLKKTIAKSLISFRESCIKALGIDVALEKAKKNFEYLYLDMEDVLCDLGIEKIADEEQLPTWMYNKKDINGNPKKVPMEEVVAPTYPQLAEKTLRKTEDVAAYLQECEQLIAETLRCDKVLVEQLGRYIEYSSWYEKGLQQAMIYPIIRKIVKVYEELKLRSENAEKMTDEETKAEYTDALKWLIIKLEDILEYLCDVEIKKIIEGDEYDVRKHKLMRTVDTEDETLNRKVAKVYSECYLLDEKVLVPAKVDVYKA